MGYRISSILAVAPNDTHSYFIYYVPSYHFASDWINQWINQHFDQIAAKIGLDGVIIGSIIGNEKHFVESIFGLKEFEMTFKDAFLMTTEENVLRHRDKELNGFFRDEHFMHQYQPCLILSCTPIHLTDKGSKSLIIRLGGCGNEKELGKIFDMIISGINTDDLSKLEKIQSSIPENIDTESSMPAKIEGNIFITGAGFDSVLQKIATAFCPARDQHT